MPRSLVPAIAALHAVLLAGCTPLGWESDPREAELRAYRGSFEAAVGTRCDAALDLQGLERQLARSRVLYLGDHHVDVALHAVQVALLEHLQRRGIRLALGLEAVGIQDEVLVERYLRGSWDLPRLGAEMARRWPGSWLDSPEVDADSYRQMLALAARAGAPVFGLEPTPRVPLRERDAAIAATVRRAAAAHPDRLIVVVVGQDHLLGRGDLVRRVGLPSVAVGARPPAEVLPAFEEVPGGELLVRAESGLWFFRSLAGAVAAQ